jgi:predicted PurR-regulated permease PerM
MISNETPFDKLRHKNRIATSFLAVSLAFILFTGSFLAVPLAFSQTNTTTTTTTTTTTSSINKEEIISSQVKSFILDQIVNKSKAAIVIGFRS